MVCLSLKYDRAILDEMSRRQSDRADDLVHLHEEEKDQVRRG